MTAARSLSVAAVVVYGNDGGAYFSDTLAARICEEAKLLGHRARMVRVYYDGGSAERDATIAERLRTWLEENEVDVVVTSRMFDRGPILAHRLADPRRRVLLLAEGEIPPSLEGIDYVIGDEPGRQALPRESIAPADMMLDAWVRALGAIGEGKPIEALSGVSAVVHGRLVRGPQILAARARRPFRATVSEDTIAWSPPPPSRNRTLHGTYGCPYSGDPFKSKHFDGVSLPDDRPIARLGCSFCPMGGDYVAGTDEQIVADLIEQARFWLANDDSVDELVLSDQHPIRYLAPLMQAAARESLRPVRWLFAARADAFVREADALEAALVAARAAGQVLEVYLTGFESFSEAELARYNKGVGVATELAAVDTMRALKRRHPASFDYGKSRGHSLILFNPWTEPSDLRASVDTLRAHGMRDLFHDLGRNRLRLHPTLPIFYAAKRDGLVAASWDEAGEGTARGLGYGSEQPWRFRDARTSRAYALSRALRDELGLESELAQLHAVTEFVEGAEATSDGNGELVRSTVASLRALSSVLDEAARTSGPTRAPTRKARVVSFAGACNNGCRSCSNGDTYLDDGADALGARVDAAREAPGPVVLAGREPTIHPEFLRLVARARGSDRRPVGVVSNGRRFAYAKFVDAAMRAGLVSASIKLFGADAITSDAHARVEGAHGQALAGIRHLAAAGVTTEARLVLHRGVLADAAKLVDVAMEAGARQACLDVAVDAVSLAALSEARDAVSRVLERAAALGLPMRVNPLGHPGFEAMPTRAPARAP